MTPEEMTQELIQEGMRHGAWHLPRYIRVALPIDIHQQHASVPQELSHTAFSAPCDGSS